MASLLTVAALSHLVPESIQAVKCDADFRARLLCLARATAFGTHQASMTHGIRAANGIAAQKAGH